MMRKEEIDNIVVGLVESASSRNLGDILSELNISLYRIDASRPLLRGGYACYIESPKRDTIYLSRDCPDEMRSFVIAHEIGHAVLHDVEIRHYGISKRGDKEEEEADYFALRLLDPEWDPSEVEGYGSDQVATMLGVSERSVKYLV